MTRGRVRPPPKFWSLGTYLGLGGGLTRPLVIVGFNQMVILITNGMMYFTMEAVFVVCILAMKLTSVHMCLKK